MTEDEMVDGIIASMDMSLSKLWELVTTENSCFYFLKIVKKKKKKKDKF